MVDFVVGQVVVPGVIGSDREGAAALLDAAYLSASFIPIYNPLVEAGRVYLQSIPEGTDVDPGTTVKLTISAQPNYRFMTTVTKTRKRIILQ